MVEKYTYYFVKNYIESNKRIKPLRKEAINNWQKRK